MSEEAILRKLVEAGSFKVTSETEEDEVADWEPLVEPFTKGWVGVVKPIHYAEIIESAVEKLCKKVAETETDYPATWEDHSSVKLYWCPSVDRFVVVDDFSSPGYSEVEISVYKSARDAVRAYNATISDWIDRLYEHSRLEVPGAEESAERARELRREKLKLKDVMETLRRLKATIIEILR